MFSKQKLKYVNSLQIKKFRQEHQAFLVEGAKSVLELLNSDFEVEMLLVTPQFFDENKIILKKFLPEILETTELEKIGTLQSNNAAIAVAKMKENKPLICNENEHILVLDDIQDPGNMGTIIRIADWYNIRKIICSANTVEVYNPKVISATMGSFTRINLYYCDLQKYLQQIAGGEPHNQVVIGTFLDGINIHHFDFPKSGYIVLGNEANGISAEIEKLISWKITIPKFGNAESLNAGIAAAVVLDNLRRK